MKYRVEISLNKVDDNGEVFLIRWYTTRLMANFGKVDELYDQLRGIIQVKRVRK